MSNRKKHNIVTKRKNIIYQNDKNVHRFKNEKHKNTIYNNSPTKNKAYKNGIKRVSLPLNKIRIRKEALQIKFRKMTPHSVYGPRNKKTYIICRCQPKSTRLSKLKNIAANAIKENKIFCIYGNSNIVRESLLERGWVEKIQPNRMNFDKIRDGTLSNKNDIKNEIERLLLSNLVEKCNPNFIWRTTESRGITTNMKDCKTNKLEIDAIWTSKQGLCSIINNNYWYYIEDVAEVNNPRTFSITDTSELSTFVGDYRITACTSLLKWIISMVTADKPVFVSEGKVSMNIVVFALNRCKEYIFSKQNKDIDRIFRTINDRQWNSFLKKYYSIISKDEVFQSDKQNKLPLYLGYANFLLKVIHKYRPQLSCEGCHNIWIIKPAHCSRGRGIRMASRLGVITNLLKKANSKYVIQKYIEEPLLIHETKFDIRQYFLITSTYPLIIWMYRDCYLKFSSQKYSLKNYDESIHLTNNAVQKKYANCNGRHADLPNYNMWDLEKYKRYLCKLGKEYVWDDVIYPGMKKSIINIMLSCQETLTANKNRFELYGCDFVLDREYKPWLIEINSGPDLNHTTPVTAKICPAVVADIIKVVIDLPNEPKCSTGQFECVYRQIMTTPRYENAAELNVRGYNLPSEYFYKGNIDIKESYEDSNISGHCDIHYMLKRLKQYLNTKILKDQPKDNAKEKSNT